MGSPSKTAKTQQVKRARKPRVVRTKSPEPLVFEQQADGDVLRRIIAKPDSSAPADLLALQRLAGNAAAQRLTKNGAVVQRTPEGVSVVAPQAGGLVQRGWFSRAASWVKDKASRAYQGVKGAATKVYGAAKSGVGKAWKSIKGAAGRAYGTVKSGVAKAYSRVKGAVTKAWGRAKSGASKAYQAAKGAVNSALQWAKRMGSKALGGATKFIKTAGSKLAKAYTDAKDFAVRVFKGMVKWARRAVGIVGPPEAVRPTADGKILGAHQAGRVKTKYADLTSKDKDKFDDLLLKAKSESEQRYIYKALAAGHTVEEIKTFAGRIRGKNAAWMQNNLRLTGSTTGTGIQQQWSTSCNITAVQAVRGEMDPIYSLKVHDENPNFATVDNADATKKNPKLAAEQKAGLETAYGGTKWGAHTGVAVARGAAGGKGRFADDMLNDLKKTTGLKFTPKIVGGAGADLTLDQARASIDTALDKGMPVPLVIGDNGAKKYGHYVLVTGKTKGPPKKYTIHDPWSGKTVTRTEDDLKNGTINIAGWNHIGSIDDPSAAK